MGTRSTEQDNAEFVGGCFLLVGAYITRQFASALECGLLIPLPYPQVAKFRVLIRPLSPPPRYDGALLSLNYVKPYNFK